MTKKDVVVIGAGPYGLSAAAHLQHGGADPYVIGQPMQFWKTNMPKQMLLRSQCEASNIAAPQPHLSIEGYQKAIGRKLENPLPIEDFIAYGDWFQKQILPNLDQRKVQNVLNDGRAFQITFEDGEKLEAKSVVLTLGIGFFYQRPEQFASIPRELAPHSSELSDLSQFSGKRVAVLGNGQSALEYAAILHEHGAQVDILTRAAALKFRPFAWRKHLFRTLTGGPLRSFSYSVFPPTDLGDIRTARKMADPRKFRSQPPEVQASLIKDCTKPVGAYWLEDRLQGVRIRTRTTVKSAAVAGNRVKLELNDGSSDTFDLVMLATGYKIDINKYPMLDGSLKKSIQQTPDFYPVLSSTLETSVKGLYMAGVIAERTLGPTLRFVTGTSNAGPQLAAGIVGTPSIA